MPAVSVNGVRLEYDRQGQGPLVVMIMGSAARRQVWHAHQLPVLVGAGYQVLTFDNRGIAPSQPPPGLPPRPFTVFDMAADTIALLEQLADGPCHLVGVSLGAVVAQEVALARPDLVRAGVFMATKARSDVIRQAHLEGELQLADSGVQLPARYLAAVTAMQMLSPRTLDHDADAADWLELFTRAAKENLGAHQLPAMMSGDRTDALRAIRRPCLVIAFSDDLVTPPRLGREVAAAIPGCQYLQLPGCGHLGYLERPELVNAAILDFLAGCGRAS